MDRRRPADVGREGSAAVRPWLKIAAFVLQAAGTAAQSERDELALLIDYAVQLED